jgi:hypothetical protein
MLSRLARRYAVAGLCFCLPTYPLVSLFLGLFSSLHIANMHTNFHPSYRTISTAPPTYSLSPHLVPWATGCILSRFPLPLSRASSYVYSWHLLYLSLDGVIPEAFIYVYIPYNISCVSSVDR